MEFEESAVAIGLAREQSFHFALLDLRPEHGQRSLAFLDGLLVVLVFAKIDEHGGVVQPRVEFGIAVERGVEMLTLAQELLGALGIFPKDRILGEGV